MNKDPVQKQLTTYTNHNFFDLFQVPTVKTPCECKLRSMLKPSHKKCSQKDLHY